ncbi:MAG: Ppx/GppA family phosphatase [Sutterella sp.]|nr:Ppx/GppA family phosphatase [Sutterella sp.]
MATVIDKKGQPVGFVRPNPMVTRVGFIDLGSNSSRLTVVEFDRRGRVTILNRVKSMVRLGEGAFETKCLQPQAMERAVKCLAEFAEVCRSYGVKEIIAVGTAALRVASNSQDFVRTVVEKTGIDLQVISGEEEARLIRVGVWDALPKTRDAYLFIDIGGGSTELSVSSRDKIDFLESLNVGCVMLTDAVRADKNGRINAAAFERMQERALEKMQHTLSQIKKTDYKAALASSGTAQALLTLAQAKFSGTEPFEVTEEGVKLKRDQVVAIAKELSAMTLAERQKLPGLSPARAEVIVGGAAVLLSLMQALKLPHVFITDNNLQDGQVVDYTWRHFSEDSGHDWRNESVKALAKRYGCEKAHAKHLVAVSGAIFSQAQALGLFDAEVGLDELLVYAAKLHDVGIAISYDKHYQHGAYLVRFCPLLGFTQKEVLTIARLVYLHSRPSSDLPAFLAGDALSEAQKWAALCLFMAENLDRTHRSMVRDVKLALNNRDLVLDVELKEASPLETASVEKIKKQVKKLLGRNIEVRFEIAERHIELVHD